MRNWIASNPSIPNRRIINDGWQLCPAGATLFEMSFVAEFNSMRLETLVKRSQETTAALARETVAKTKLCLELIKAPDLLFSDASKAIIEPEAILAIPAEVKAELRAGVAAEEKKRNDKLIALAKKKVDLDKEVEELGVVRKKYFALLQELNK